MNIVTKFPKSGRFYVGVSGMHSFYQVQINRSEAKYLWDNAVKAGDMTLSIDSEGDFYFDNV